MKIEVIKNKNLVDFEDWPVWTCEKSKFNWEYDQEEHCFIIEGSVTVTNEINNIKIMPGDYVKFPKGLKCHWEVHSAIKKHYNFK